MPGKRIGTRVAGVARALFSPDRAFADGDAAALPRVALLLLSFVLVVVGGRLGSAASRTPEAGILAMNEVDAQVSSLLAAAPAAAQAMARRQMLDALVGGSSGVAAAFSIVLGGVGFVAVLLELWLACTIITQFFGGQEERRGWDRGSLALVLVAGVPLALRRFLGGLLSAARGAGAALNSLTIEEYRARVGVRFDLLAVAGVGNLPPIVTAAARLVTDPFVLWSLVILVLGGRAVYRLPLRAATGQVLVLLALLGLQSWLIGRLGLSWEL